MSAAYFVRKDGWVNLDAQERMRRASAGSMPSSTGVTAMTDRYDDETPAMTDNEAEAYLRYGSKLRAARSFVRDMRELGATRIAVRDVLVEFPGAAPEPAEGDQ